MALTADGWHMATHVLALSIAGFAYRFARAPGLRRALRLRHVEDRGAGILLERAGARVVAIAMAFESVRRLLVPETIQYAPALVVAALGLVVNLVSALVLQQAAPDHHHAHDHDHDHAHGHAHHGHQDLNMRSAYATS
jgi:Co/Zn/Cd efflux system component